MTIYDYDFDEVYELEEDELIDESYDSDNPYYNERREDSEFRSYMEIAKGGFNL